MTSGAFQRHATTVLTTVITVLLCWIGFTTHQTAVAVAEVSVKLEGIGGNAARIERLEERLRDLEQLQWH